MDGQSAAGYGVYECVWVGVGVCLGVLCASMNRKAISSFNVKSNERTKAARQKCDQSEKTNLRCFKSKH